MSQYLGVDGLDFGAIPKFICRSTSFFTSTQLNSVNICKHEFTTLKSNKQKQVLISEVERKMIL